MWLLAARAMPRAEKIQLTMTRWSTSIRCQHWARTRLLRGSSFNFQSQRCTTHVNIGSCGYNGTSISRNSSPKKSCSLGQRYCEASALPPHTPISIAVRHRATMTDGATASSDAKTAQDGQELRALLSLRRFVWPKDDVECRRRVLVAASLMMISKGLGLAVPVALRSIIDTLVPTSPTMVVGLPVLALLSYGGLRLAQSACSELRNVAFSTVSARALSGLSKDVFCHLQRLSLQYHLSRQTGAVSVVVNRGVRGLQWLLSVVVFNVLPTMFEISIVSGLLWYSLGLEFALVNVCTIIAYITWTFSITSWRTQIRRRMNEAETKSGSLIVDSLLNYETIKYFGAQSIEMRKYGAQLAQYEDGLRNTATSLGLLNFGQQMIFTAGMTTMMYMCTQGVVTGTMSVGDLVMANTLLLQLSQPLNWLGTMYSESRRSLVDLQGLHSILEEPPENPLLNIGAAPLLLPPGSAPSVEFRGVSFQYPGSSDLLLREISFHVPGGTTIAFVGASGSGKSTLFRLLFRFFDQLDGSIFLEGCDLRDLTVESVRQHIGVIPQDVVLFNASLRDNIAYGSPDASHEEIEAVVRAVALNDLMATLPDGLETQVGERGLKLSGGEKQRVAIARTMLRRPSLLLVDEGTASLDSQTESHVMTQLRNLSSTQQVTTLVIAHRLSTVQHADQIAVIHKGSIAELGSHVDLLSRNGLYHSLWQRQQADDA